MKSMKVSVDSHCWICQSLSICIVLLTAISATADEPQAKAKKSPAKPAAKQSPLQPIEDRAGLPRVLLIGDSISIGYTLPVRELLEGEANVHRPPTNCSATIHGLEQIERWLGDKPWDVIHFNWGLHDLKYMGPNGENLASPNDPKNQQQVPIDQYEQNLRKLVERIRKTEATLIWCSTTPVPEGSRGRVSGDAAKYNAVAAKVMNEHGVAIDDLYAFAKPRLAEIQLKANVHFTPAGSQQLAEQVAKSIREALAGRHARE